LFKKTGGEYIRDVIVKYMRFQKTKKIYLYDETDYSVDTSTNIVDESSLPIQKG
jgi:hypothetical protein